MAVAKKVVSPQSDTAWKDILEGCFQDFVDYCLPELSAAIDWSKPVEFLDKELHAITKDGLTGTRLLDKLFKVFLKTGIEQWILIHVEVQGVPDSHFSKRMFTYGYRIYDRYQQPIISCAILTDKKNNWRPNNFEVGDFGSRLGIEFLVIKLIDYRPKMDELEASNNPFASVILTQLAALDAKRQPDEVRKDIKYNLTKRLYEKGFSKEKIKQLYLFLDWLIHLPPELELEYTTSVYQLEESKKMRYVSSIERIGIEKGKLQGMSQGRQEGEASLLIRQLTRKFGELPQNYRERIVHADAETLLIWGERILDVEKLEDIFKA